MTHLELAGMFEIVKVRLQFERFLQVLQELALERENLLDVAEQRLDFGAGQERFAFQRLQIVFEQVVEMLDGLGMVSD